MNHIIKLIYIISYRFIWLIYKLYEINYDMIKHICEIPREPPGNDHIFPNSNYLLSRWLCFSRLVGYGFVPGRVYIYILNISILINYRILVLICQGCIIYRFCLLFAQPGKVDPPKALYRVRMPGFCTSRSRMCQRSTSLILPRNKT